MILSRNRKVTIIIFFLSLLSALNLHAQSFIGERKFSFDTSFLMTSLKNHGWGLGINYEVQLFDYFSIKPAFSHTTIFPEESDGAVKTVGVDLSVNFYPFNRGLDWLYIGIGNGCEFIMTKENENDDDSTIRLFPIAGWKQSYGDLLYSEIFCCYNYLLHESESSDYAKNGFEYGIKLKLNLKKILFNKN